MTTIFLNDIMSIDYAQLHPIAGSPIGGSCCLSVEVTYKSEPACDIGTIASTIKSLVESPVVGFDHRLWIPLYRLGKPGISDIDCKIDTDHIAHINTKTCALSIPNTAIRHVDYRNPETSIEDMLNRHLQQAFPRTGIRAKVFLSYEVNLPDNLKHSVVRFRYTHGLRNGSLASQNIAHGYLSWLVVRDAFGGSVSLGDSLTSSLLGVLDSSVFVCKSDIIGTDEANTTKIGYTCNLGKFSAEYSEHVHLNVLDKETTIENIAKWVVELFHDEFVQITNKMGRCTLQISEGFNNGCVIDLPTQSSV
jgi:hypothetical protein